jgi:hypothetical protein
LSLRLEREGAVVGTAVDQEWRRAHRGVFLQPKVS